MIDSFGPLSNDDLQARVRFFQIQLAKEDAEGFVVLSGPLLLQHFNQRQILGCSRFMRMPEDNLRFKFSDNRKDLGVEFWKIPKGFGSAEFTAGVQDYKLSLSKPVEMTVSMATDEFCPRYFELDWYAKFLIANPSLSGRAVIDVPTRREFVARVTRYRKELLSYGVAANRMRFFLRHFHGERDEQFWLIPPKRK